MIMWADVPWGASPSVFYSLPLIRGTYSFAGFAGQAHSYGMPWLLLAPSALFPLIA